MRRPVTLGLGGLLAVALAGCSQVAALAPVSGKQLDEVRTAAGDVLLAQKVQILTAPACSTTGTTVTCDGMTLDNAAIAVTAVPGAEPGTLVMDLTVGSRTIYHGSVQDVLNAAAGPAS